MLRRDPIRGTRNRASRRSAKMGNRRLPQLGAKGVECQPVGFLVYLIGIILFTCRERGRMHGTPPIGRQHVISDIVNEGVLERVFKLGKQLSFLQKFGGLQPREGLPKLVRGQFADDLQYAKRNLVADNGSGLKQTLVLSAQSVDAGGQQG